MTNPVWDSDRKMSTAILPGSPMAFIPMSLNELPGQFWRAESSFIAQVRVITKERNMAIADHSQPPFL